MGAREAQAQLALETAHPTGQMHQQEAISFEARGPFFGRKAQSLDGAGNIIREQRQLEPRGVDRKMPTGHVTPGQGVFDLVMHVLDRASFLPVPVQQLGSVPIQIGHHRMVMAVGAVVKEQPLGLEQTQPHIPQSLPCSIHWI